MEDENDEVTETVYNKFKEQLNRLSEDRYETGLLWKSGKDNLESSKMESIVRLQNLVKRLNKDLELFAQYDNIIQEQLKEDIIEIAPNTLQGTELNLPHHPVVRQEAETTKVCIVYNGSAQEGQSVPFFK